MGLPRNSSKDSSLNRTPGMVVNQLAQTGTFSKKLAPSSLTAMVVVHNNTTTQVASIIKDAKIVAHSTNLHPTAVDTIIKNEGVVMDPPRNLEFTIDRTLEEVPIITTLHLISNQMQRTVALPVRVPTQNRGPVAFRGEVVGTAVLPNTRVTLLSI